MVAKAGGIDVTFNAIDIEGSVQGTPLIELSPETISHSVGKRIMASDYASSMMATVANISCDTIVDK